MIPAELAALSAELHDDPLGIGYAAHLPGDPQRAADLLNAPNYTMLKPMTAARALVWAGLGGYGKIIDTANSAGAPGRDSCLAFRDNVMAGQPVDLSDPDVQQLFDGWEELGVITAEQHARALAFATQPASRAEILNLPALSARDIVDAWGNA